MDLPQTLIIKAEIELQETDKVRAQSLNELREWIASHDYFTDCRKGELKFVTFRKCRSSFSFGCNTSMTNFLRISDDKFLLQFLRTKKFRVDKAMELFEVLK